MEEIQQKKEEEEEKLMPPPSMNNPSKKIKLNEEEKNLKNKIEINYKPPHWSSEPIQSYKLEVLKNGIIIEEIDIGKKPFYLLGRIPICDIVLDHPSISRQHAILQHKGDTNKVFVYDLNSTHGTFLNKKKIPSNSWIQVEPGSSIKFGQSTRIYILSGYEKNEEIEKEEYKILTQQKIKQQLMLQKQIELQEQLKIEKEKKEEEELINFQGTWEEAEELLNKKKQKNKKEESSQEENNLNLNEEEGGEDDGRRHWIDGYPESDEEDEFFDRTLEFKKKRKKEKSNNQDINKPKIETVDSLKQKKLQLELEKQNLVNQIRDSQEQKEENNNMDSLDSFMNNLSKIKLTKSQILKAENQIKEIEKEIQKLQKLINLVTPALEGLVKK